MHYYEIWDGFEKRPVNERLIIGIRKSKLFNGSHGRRANKTYEQCLAKKQKTEGERWNHRSMYSLKPTFWYINTNLIIVPVFFVLYTAIFKCDLSKTSLIHFSFEIVSYTTIFKCDLSKASLIYFRLWNYLNMRIIL